MEILKDDNNNYIKDTNPIEKFSEVENDIISLYLQCNQLKNLYRQGWLKIRIGLEHKEKCESVADHSFGVSLLALSIIEKHKLKLDILKCLKMAIIHELGEVYIGDFTPFDKITKEEKYQKEKNAIKEVMKEIRFENDFQEIWEEFEECKTEESKFMKQIDGLEFLMQAVSYGYDIKYFNRSINNIKDKHLVEILENLLKVSEGNKKPTIID